MLAYVSFLRHLNIWLLACLLGIGFCLLAGTSHAAAQAEKDASRARLDLVNMSETPAPTALAGFDPRPASPTGLPTNPAQITGQQLKTAAGEGVLVVIGAALVAGIYFGARAALRR